MITVTLTEPWLEMDFGRELQVLSWAVNKPGFAKASRILWREVNNRDLPRDMDVCEWLGRELHARDAQDAVTFLTSRRITVFEQSIAHVGHTTAHAVATVGLSNAERIGHRVDYSNRDWSTINIAVSLNRGLTQVAMIEAMSIAVAARTVAVMEMQFSLPTGVATGTGTDCVAIAAPRGPSEYAGMHTEIGEAIGRAVYDAVILGAQNWGAEQWEKNRRA